MNAGQIVIDAVIRSKAIESAEHPTPDSTLFVWSANAEEQIEAALNEAGYSIYPTTTPTTMRILMSPFIMEGVNSKSDLKQPPAGFDHALARDNAKSDLLHEWWTYVFEHGKWSDESSRWVSNNAFFS